MKKQHDSFERIFNTLEIDSLPTDQQKEKMLNFILEQGDRTAFDKIAAWIEVYPWRFAFGFSAVQAVAFSLFFGTGYTNLILGFFGG